MKGARDEMKIKQNSCVSIVNGLLLFIVYLARVCALSVCRRNKEMVVLLVSQYFF